eukprot:2355061-Prymnesium_polylepis.1
MAAGRSTWSTAWWLIVAVASTGAQPTADASPTGGEPVFPAGGVPGEHAGAVGDEVWSGSFGGSFFNVTAPALYPRLVPNATTAVIVSPGGSYKWLSWELEGESAARWLNGLGVSAFILKYRVPARPWLPFGGTPLMDIQRARGITRCGRRAPLAQ